MSTLVNNHAIETYSSGAQRDLPEHHGRCDLLPLLVIRELIGDDSTVLLALSSFIYHGEDKHLYIALKDFIGMQYDNDKIGAMLELSRHYKNCLVKYPERNWEKGIPLHSYLDSAIRHYLKWFRKDKDEDHAVAFLWNLVCAIWTLKNRPEQNDLPFKKGDKDIG